jgi:hypothetical protein
MEGKNKRTIIMLGVLVGLLALSYPYLSKNWQSGDSAMVEGAATSPQVSAALSQIESVKLDVSLFQNKTLKQLRDFTLAPLNLQTGKTNPFR